MNRDRINKLIFMLNMKGVELMPKNQVEFFIPLYNFESPQNQIKLDSDIIIVSKDKILKQIPKLKLFIENDKSFILPTGLFIWFCSIDMETEDYFESWGYRILCNSNNLSSLDVPEQYRLAIWTLGFVHRQEHETNPQSFFRPFCFINWSETNIFKLQGYHDYTSSRSLFNKGDIVIQKIQDWP